MHILYHNKNLPQHEYLHFCQKIAILFYNTSRHRLTARTPDSHSGNRGSIPRGGTRIKSNEKNILEKIAKTILLLSANVRCDRRCF